MTPDEIVLAARKEIAEEDYRKQVDAMKVVLRSKRSLWQKLFPFEIKITRRK